MDGVNVLKQGCCVFRNLFLKLVKMEHFRQAITISSICNKEFRNMFSVGFIPTWATVWGTARLLMFFNGWPTLVGRVTLFFMPLIGGKSNGWGPKVKVHGYCAVSSSTSGAFGKGDFACPTDKNKSVRLSKLCRTGMRKLKRGGKKLRTPVIMLFRSGGVIYETAARKSRS